MERETVRERETERGCAHLALDLLSVEQVVTQERQTDRHRETDRERDRDRERLRSPCT